MKLIRHFSNYLCGKMAEKGLIKENDLELYAYGIENGAIIMANVLTAVLIGILTGRLEIVLVFLFFYVSLRSYSGGFHLESKLLCYIFSNVILLIPVYSYDWTVKHIPILALCIIGIAAVILVIVLSPVESIHKRLDEDERIFYKRISRCLVSIESCIVVAFYFLEQYRFCYAGFVSVLLIAIFMVIGAIHANRYT